MNVTLGIPAGGKMSKRPFDFYRIAKILAWITDRSNRGASLHSTIRLSRLWHAF